MSEDVSSIRLRLFAPKNLAEIQNESQCLDVRPDYCCCIQRDWIERCSRVYRRLGGSLSKRSHLFRREGHKIVNN